MFFQKKDGNDVATNKPKARPTGPGFLPPPPGGVKIAPPPAGAKTPTPTSSPAHQPSNSASGEFPGESTQGTASGSQSWGEFTSAGGPSPPSNQSSPQQNNASWVQF